MPANKKVISSKPTTSTPKTSPVSRELLQQLAYPGSQPVPVTSVPPTGIKILEMVTTDNWQPVLQYYQQLLTAQEWMQFAQHQQSDRGTYSFRHTSTVITVLAAQASGPETRVRIYIQR
jgi:hypothetical protein